MFSIAWEQIMDLIGSIKYVENRPGGRNPNQGKGTFAPKNARNDAAEEKNTPVVADKLSAEGGILLGLKIDTTA